MAPDYHSPQHLRLPCLRRHRRPLAEKAAAVPLPARQGGPVHAGKPDHRHLAHPSRHGRVPGESRRGSAPASARARVRRRRLEPLPRPPQLCRTSMPPRTTAGAVWPDIWTAATMSSASSIWRHRPACSVPSPNGCAPAGWLRRNPASCWKSRSATTWNPPAGSTTRSAASSPRSRSTGSTITWERRRSRTCWRCVSPTRCSSRCGTPAISTTSRSPSPRRSAWRAGAATTTRPGALRDMVQNHLMQLVCLVGMEPPVSLDKEAVRDEKIKVLRSLSPIGVENISTTTVRGQYRAGAVGGAAVRGYLEEEGIGSDSNTETFVALKAEVHNWRWSERAVLSADRQADAGEGVGDRHPVPADPALHLPARGRRNHAQPAGRPLAAGRGDRPAPDRQGTRPRRHAAARGSPEPQLRARPSRTAFPTPMSGC